MNDKTVRDVLASLPYEQDPPAVSRGATLKDVVRAIVKGHRWRVVYVLDAEGTLTGAISLDLLKDTIFRRYLNGRVSETTIISEHIVDIYASEKAEDVMDAAPVTCHVNARLQDIISRMIEQDITDMPVVDDKRHLVANVDILDLFDFWLKEGGNTC